MPALLTHYLFAKGLRENPSPAFLLGAQGADPYFYYAQRRKRDHTEEVRAYALFIHRHDFSALIGECLDYANSSGDDKEMLLDFISGFLSHYCLDRLCHPYVFYRSGFDLEKGYVPPFTAAHAKLESYIDAMLGWKHGLDAIHMERVLEIPEKDLKAISKMLFVCQSKVESKDGIDENTYSISVKDCGGTMAFLNRPRWLKRMLVRLLRGSRSQAYCLIYPRRLSRKEKSLDLLNESHSVWRDPVSGEERHLSFEELFLPARELYLKMEEALAMDEEGSKIAARLSELYGGIDFDGTPEGKRKAYFRQSFDEFPKGSDD